jgi:hypothetical protein
MGTLNSTKYGLVTRALNSSQDVLPNDTALVVSLLSGSVTLTLNQIPDNSWQTSYKLYVSISAMKGAGETLTINAGSGQKINGQQTLVLDNIDYAAIIRVTTNNTYIAQLNYTQSNDLAILDEGFALTLAATSIDFEGDGVTATNVGNDVTVTINGLTDSGWTDLAGFNFFNGTIAKPQYRVIGKQICFRNPWVVPLDDGSGVVIPYGTDSVANGGTTYTNKLLTAPYTGAGGVTLVSAGGLQWNNNNPAITNPLHLPDGAYTSNYMFGFRRVVSLSNPTTAHLIYYGVFRLIISQTGVISMQTLFNDEESVGGQAVNNSILRYVTSMTTAGHYALDFNNINGGAATLIGNSVAAPMTAAITQQAITHGVTLNAGRHQDLGGWAFIPVDLHAYTV